MYPEGQFRALRSRMWSNHQFTALADQKIQRKFAFARLPRLLAAEVPSWISTVPSEADGVPLLIPCTERCLFMCSIYGLHPGVFGFPGFIESAGGQFALVSGHLRAARGIRADYGPCPEPCNDSSLISIRQLCLWIEMADPFQEPGRASTDRNSELHPPARARQSTYPLRSSLLLRPDSTGGCPANLGGISIRAFVMRTATGFKSLANVRF